MKKTAPLTCLFAMLCMGISAQNYCIPQTQSYCCGYGITSVTLPNLYQASADASVGYQNFSSQTTSATEGNPFSLQIQTGGVEPHDVRAWLDVNDNGIFEHPGELVFESLNAPNPTGTLNIPAGTPLADTLRLRITADFAGSDPMPCTHPVFGQTEDYSLFIIPSTEWPVADFIASTTSSCNGRILFSEQCSGNPSTYFWDFGDGQTATTPLYTHTYAESGTYTVSLTVSNSLGSDTHTKTDYIQVSLSETCDTFSMPAQGSHTVLYACNHVLTDNGKLSNYSDNTNGIISLSPLWAEKVCLRFSAFHFEEGFDYIEIYDGASPAAPLIGKYSGTNLPPDVCSTGPALCIRQHTDDIVNYSGFVAQANCTLGSGENIPTSWMAQIYPNPFSQELHIALPSDTYGPWELTLVSVTGKAVYRKSFTDTPTAILSLSIPAGIYALDIRSASGSWQQKIIKLP